MRQTTSGYTALLLLLVVGFLIVAWPGRLQKQVDGTPEYQPMPTRAEPDTLPKEAIADLDQAYANLREIEALGYETHLEEFAAAAQAFQEAVTRMPTLTGKRSYDLAYLQRTPDVQAGRVATPAPAEFSAVRQHETIQHVQALAAQSREASDRLLQQVVRAKLQHVQESLAFLRSTTDQLSDQYVAAHQAYLAAREHLATINRREAAVPARAGAHPRQLETPAKPPYSGVTSSPPQADDRPRQFEATPRPPISATAVENADLSSAARPKMAPNYQKAARALRESQTLSQRLLSEYYLDDVIRPAQSTRKKLGAVVRDDPDNALQTLSDELDAELASARERGDQNRPVTVAQITHIRQIRQEAEFNLIMQQRLNRVVQFDIVFHKGEYKLSDEGQQLLHTMGDELVTLIAEYAASFPQQSVSLAIQTVCYADEVGFCKQCPLLDELTHDTEQPMPQAKLARRKWLNARLSLLRAKTISTALRDLLLTMPLPETITLDIQTTVEGKGEAIPPAVPGPYPRDDPRRRICRISNLMWSAAAAQQ